MPSPEGQNPDLNPDPETGQLVSRRSLRKLIDAMPPPADVEQSGLIELPPAARRALGFQGLEAAGTGPVRGPHEQTQFVGIGSVTQEAYRSGPGSEHAQDILGKQ